MSERVHSGPKWWINAVAPASASKRQMHGLPRRRCSGAVRWSQLISRITQQSMTWTLYQFDNGTIPALPLELARRPALALDLDAQSLDLLIQRRQGNVQLLGGV